MGLIRWIRSLREGHHRRRQEDALKYLQDCAWNERQATVELLGKALGLSRRVAGRVCRGMEERELVRFTAEGVELTERGHFLSMEVIRAHRLWERYLADEAQMPLLNIHREADRREHDRSEEEMQALDATLGYPKIDPHGDPIPSSDGSFDLEEQCVLTKWPRGLPARVVHVEDEPVEHMRRIVRAGLRPGVTLRVMDRRNGEIVFEKDDGRHVLSRAVCENVHVCTGRLSDERAEKRWSLTELGGGEEALVAGLDEACRGMTRRRLLDLGFTPGTRVEVELANAGGSARAYRIRDTLIALRREQAEQVLIQSPNGEGRVPIEGAAQGDKK